MSFDPDETQPIISATLYESITADEFKFAELLHRNRFIPVTKSETADALVRKRLAVVCKRLSRGFVCEFYALTQAGESVITYRRNAMERSNVSSHSSNGRSG